MELGAKSLRSSSLHFFFTFSLLIISNIIPTIQAKTTYQSSTKTYQSYIKKACDSATYPKDCYKSLSSYASTIKSDPNKLYKVTLAVTIREASKTSSCVSSLLGLKGLSPVERGIVRDCAETVGEAIDELKQSLKALKKLQGADRVDQVQNIRTWVSAALTDEGTCTDEFDGQKVSNLVNKNIKKRMFDLAKLTSNCLALADTLNY